MTKAETIKALERKYHVCINKDYFTGPYFSNELKESFDIYSADGCCYDRVIGYRSLIKTLAEGKESLKRLAKDKWQRELNNALKELELCDDNESADGTREYINTLRGLLAE